MDKSTMDDTKKGATVSRRDFLKAGALAGATALVAAGAGAKEAKAEESKRGSGYLKGKNIAMVVDLQRCTGCGACLIACKNENNVTDGITWAKSINRTEGKFPNVRLEYLPTRCNHCDNAPCVKGCPTKAMHKGEGGLTRHDKKKCIGCKTCVVTCPYGMVSTNKRRPYEFWRDKSAAIKDGTGSPAETTEKSGAKNFPYENSAVEPRYRGIAEKCTFCVHLLEEGKTTYCVTACPSSARIAGDLNDPNSTVSRLISTYRPYLIKEHLGTKPKTFYIRAFNAGNYRKTKGDIG